MKLSELSLADLMVLVQLYRDRILHEKIEANYYKIKCEIIKRIESINFNA